MTKTPDTYFANIEDSLAPVAFALRETIFATGPELSEGLAWGFPCYSGNERIFSIIAHSAHVNLQLWYGAALAGKNPRIEGTGKSLRHVKLKTLAEIDDGLKTTIAAAIALDFNNPRIIA